MKKNYKDMLLESGSGFMMPFPLRDDEELQTTLGFGLQQHPTGGQKFEHHGVDLLTSGKPLYSIATGTVIGAGHDSIHEDYIIAKYGKYEVKYGHITEAYCPYGTSIRAGQEIGKSGQFLHLEVRFDGVTIDPMEFLAMIWANIQQLAAMGINNAPTTEQLGSRKPKTHYDKEQDEILMMMMRWLPAYMNELRLGSYTPSERMQTTLKHVISEAAERNYFFEKLPDMANPLGLTGRCLPVAEKIQNLLIEDFLSYAWLRHDACPASWAEAQKKTFSSSCPRRPSGGPSVRFEHTR